MHELEKLYRQEKLKYIRLVSRSLRINNSEAEDVFHNAIEKATKNYKNFNPNIGKFSSWFNRIILNEISNFLYKTNKRQSLLDDKPIDQILDYSSLLEDSPEILIEFFKDEDKRILIHLHILGYSIKETSAILKISKNKVRHVNNKFKKDL